MKLPHVTKPSESAGQGRNALLGGSYSLALTAILLAILIALNVLVGALPASQTKYDISSSKLYSITSNTKVVVNALEEDADKLIQAIRQIFPNCTQRMIPGYGNCFVQSLEQRARPVNINV